MKALTAMRVALTVGETGRGTEKGTKNVEAYSEIAAGSGTHAGCQQRQGGPCPPLAEESVALDPGYANAYAVLANVNIMEVFVGASKSPRESLDRAEELAKKPSP